MVAKYRAGDEGRLIGLYLEARKDPMVPVSLAHAVRAIRTVLDESAYTDRQLAELVAKAAARDHRIVAFDLAGRTQSAEL